MTRPHKLAVVIGRWQLFHRGHQQLVSRALELADTVAVVIGSSFAARSPRNPFSWREREAMVRAAFDEETNTRLRFVPVRDYYDDTRWARAVREALEPLAEGNGPPVIVGVAKDATSYYLELFPEWPSDGSEPLTVDEQAPLGATQLRAAYFLADDPDAALDVIAPYVPRGVLAWLSAWRHLPQWKQQAAEARAVAQYRKDWPGPYYLTADAVVTCQGHVLLVRRGETIGHGCWALPGGFLEPHERLLDGAMRELREETGLALFESTLRMALKDRAVFDHPHRSARGRLITEAFWFELNAESLPPVKGADDAMQAAWVPVERLPELEAQLFEDHGVILDHFLGWRSQAAG